MASDVSLGGTHLVVWLILRGTCGYCPCLCVHTLAGPRLTDSLCCTCSYGCLSPVSTCWPKLHRIVPTCVGPGPEGGKVVSRARTLMVYVASWVSCRLSAGRVLRACRNLRIRAVVTPDLIRAQASELRGH